MFSSSALTKTSLPETETLKFVSSGKVRDLYEVKDTNIGEEYLLFVASDRISAFDVILNNVSLQRSLLKSSELNTEMHICNLCTNFRHCFMTRSRREYRARESS